MTRFPGQPHPAPNPELPDALARDLDALYCPAVAVPPAVDAAILRAARIGFARRQHFRRLLRVGGAGAVAAAAAVVVLSVWVQHRPTPTAPAPTVARAALACDVNGDGRVDVLDAFLVAKAVDAKRAPPPAWDVTGDGAVDRADVDRIASLAVRVSEDTSSQDGRAMQ